MTDTDLGPTPAIGLRRNVVLVARPAGWPVAKAWRAAGVDTQPATGDGEAQLG